MSNLNTSPIDVTNIRSSAPAKAGNIRISILGHKDFSIDSMVRMLEANSNDYRISTVDPGEYDRSGLLSAEPDVLMIQNDVPGKPLERFVRDILDEYPSTRILVFGQDMSDDHLYRIVRAGVHGYINERMSGEHIVHALNAIISGQNWIERHIMERFINTQMELNKVLETRFYEKISQLCDNLTRRETEVLYEVVKGLAIKQIAEQVHLSQQSVKMHLAKLFRKFKVSNRNQLILAAFDEISPVEDLSILFRNGLQRKLCMPV